jgi:hypothetical protein
MECIDGTFSLNEKQKASEEAFILSANVDCYLQYWAGCTERTFV